MTTAAGLNWAGNYEFTAPRLHTPGSVDEVQQIVASAERVRALGTKHSFNAIADSAGDLISLVDLPPAIEIAADGRTVTVAAGTRYGIVASLLQAEGFALHNMGSLPHISVAGAVSTGTHGSGNTNGNLSTAVSGLEIVSGRGELVSVTREHPSFAGMVVGLGAFGVVTRVTLDIQPTFDVRQDLYVDLPWDAVLADFEAITSGAYSVSLFTNWVGDTLSQVWLKTVVRDGQPASMPSDFFGATPAPLTVSSPAGSDNTTVTGGVVGPWSERLPHFRLDSTPSNGDEIQSEFFVDRAHAAAALSVVRELGERIAPHLLVTELRTMAGDELWLSPAYGRDSLAIHFTWKNEPEAVMALLPDIQAALAPFGARPHWGKANTLTSATVAPLYERLPDFAALAEVYDPDHQFRNAYLTRMIGLAD
ncbi:MULTISPECIES: FAD-binding protein [Subtercola]|uniref:FAD-binding protein n=1 Tax=Subtercola vilae TaxID=2056433 RepID=A0A4T2C5G2_9MICO|nr:MULTISPECIES: FAD-binding protein [Subtercola]MEA9984783.1 FAD-binding protein [Subtercola sp. RTI3]TIH38989.1 FAD-binding protein [Subtercola vilae]